jgi:2-polyprenyl-3-methyl-5-hydroxy-6-metoxy-1,4-benzoquinol methylase
MNQQMSRLCEVCNSADFKRLFTKDKHDSFRCQSCRLIRIDPQPTDEVLAGIYGGKYYNAWGVQSDAERVQELKKATFRKHVLKNIELKKGARVLDCGAAFGALMAVAKEKGFEPYGIELAAEAAAEIARCFGKDRIFSGPFEQAIFRGVGAGDFDGIFMCDFIEHVRNPLAVVRKAASLLRPGGSLVITTPDGDSASCRLMGAGWPHYKVEHLYFFNRKNITTLLKQAGFIVKQTGCARKVLNLDYIRHQFNTYPRGLITPAINALARVAGSRLGRRPLSFSFGEMIIIGIKQ